MYFPRRFEHKVYILFLLLLVLYYYYYCKMKRKTKANIQQILTNSNTTISNTVTKTGPFLASGVSLFISYNKK